ncbi:hypothetical protein BV22DRAFT_732380 [Leucogyrophana mollusca]|uniref:Uncharacterized protein n=1 Tax=Leucogyrophana mollusca TaxID=85980 RepID=A0ACB8B7Q3_9AGAM|nr:hypothetical protein BV22DRAFT_732380 [Leucogyrophana mollusca]
MMSVRSSVAPFSRSLLWSSGHQAQVPPTPPSCLNHPQAGCRGPGAIGVEARGERARRTKNGLSGSVRWGHEGVSRSVVSVKVRTLDAAATLTVQKELGVTLARSRNVNVELSQLVVKACNCTYP